MNRTGIAAIENAFQPSRVIDTADRFVGRTTQVSQAYAELHSSGTNLVIIGKPGTGKTSLARQMINIASGNNDLLRKLEVLYDGHFDFLTIYIACGDTLKSFSDLLLNLLTAPGGLHAWSHEIPSARNEIKKLETDLKVQAASLHSVETVFTNVVSELIKAKIARNGILIVIDEFEKIENLSGCADFIKALSINVPGVKFCLVGIAEDIQGLMKARASSDGLFAGSIVYLPPMSKPELIEIINTAEKKIEHEISFTQGAKNVIANLAQGQPNLVHLLGEHALRRACLEKADSVDAKDIEKTLRMVAEGEADPWLRDLIKKQSAPPGQGN